MYALLFLSSAATAVLFMRTVAALRLYRSLKPVDRAISIQSTPSVSVCVAARNETHALAQCLERLLASDYPKLEILVLDDSSDDGTSLIIKSFANAGVRFVPGKSLPDGWLGKNHAYQTLVDEASGDILLFVDVDTIVRTTTISRLVAMMGQFNIDMLSVLPRRDDGFRTSALFGTMRYYWELLLGTRTSPPAASAIWMVATSALKKNETGLDHYAMSVRPERHMARQLHRQKKYRYIIGDEALGVSYEKHLHSQHETALRLYYPMTGRTLMNWFSASLFLSLLVVPLVVLASWQWDHIAFVWSFILIAAIAATFGMFVRRTYSRLVWQIRILIGPLLVIQELVLLLVSYINYRRGRITWKGRAVTEQPRHRDALNLSE